MWRPGDTVACWHSGLMVQSSGGIMILWSADTVAWWHDHSVN
jgi:hypothetical protein